MTRLAIILLIFLSSCNSRMVVPARYENQLVITKKYYGQVCYTEWRKHSTLVVMGFGSCELVGQVSIPAWVHGYIRTEPVYQDVAPFIRDRLQHKYFSYLGSEKEYKIKTW